MSDPNETPRVTGSNQRGLGGPGFSALRGALLVLLAVIVGIVLLQAIDDGNTGPVGDGGTTVTAPPTSSGTPSGSTDSTPSSTPEAAPAPAGEVTVRVLNGSGVGGAAGTLTNTLKAQGYQTLLAGDTDARTGTVVDAKADKTAECTVLAGLIPNAKVQDMPTPVPGGTDADCIVIIGS